MTKCLFEFIGTLVLVLLGDGVVASTVLKHSKGYGGGWIVITMAWGLAVTCGVLIAGPWSGAHLNPAVSVGLAAAALSRGNSCRAMLRRSCWADSAEPCWYTYIIKTI